MSTTENGIEMMHGLAKDHFNAGWGEAIKEVAKAVTEYIEAPKTNPDVDPWEEWLPRYLARLKAIN